MRSDFFNHILPTCLLYSSFFASGFNYNVVSPTLTKLGQVYNATLPEISLLYTFRSSGYLASAPIGLAAGHFLDRKLILAVNLCLLSATILLVPFCKVLLHDATHSLVAMYTVSSINGVSSGIIEAIANVWLLEIWPPDKTTAFMQGLHFSFSIGCAVAPMVVAANFMINEYITIPYAVCSLFMVIPILMSLALMSKNSRIRATSTAKESSKSTASDTARGQKVSKYFFDGKRRVISLCCICMLFYSGSCILYNQFLPTFLQSPPQNMNSKDSSFLHSLLNYAVSFGRALAIFVAMKVPPQAIIITNLSLFLFGSVIIYLFPANLILWMGNVIIGLSWSSVSAPLYSFLKQHMKVTSVTGSVFVFCNGLTSVVTPYFTAKLMSHDSSYLMVVTMATVSLSLMAFIGVYLTIFSSIKPAERDKVTESHEFKELATSSAQSS